LHADRASERAGRVPARHTLQAKLELGDDPSGSDRSLAESREYALNIEVGTHRYDVLVYVPGHAPGAPDVSRLQLIVPANDASARTGATGV